MIKFVTNILQNRKKHAIKTKWLLFFLSKYKQVRISANIFNKENVTCFFKMRSIAILFCHRISGHCNGSIGSYNKKGKVLQGDRYGRNSPMSLGRLLIQFHKLEAVSAHPSPFSPSIKPKSVRGVWVILHREARNWPIQSLSFMDLV